MLEFTWHLCKWQQTPLQQHCIIHIQYTVARTFKKKSQSLRTCWHARKHTHASPNDITIDDDIFRIFYVRSISILVFILYFLDNTLRNCWCCCCGLPLLKVVLSFDNDVLSSIFVFDSFLNEYKSRKKANDKKNWNELNASKQLQLTILLSNNIPMELFSKEKTTKKKKNMSENTI